ncbi:Cell division protein FtsN [BD1-7 clade bacterium]|uniref:Cell division protein FtsN n=1 Tax=BD1-7 clade bacterium TaxID=2029982 RepID=A0A5S9MUW7_9GAMM|nr:Cell division protein FtsN [BD1-7 clade bacterium]
MSHDFAKKNSKSKPTKKRGAKQAAQPPARKLPGWVLFFSGVAITLFGQFLWQLAQVETSANSEEPVVRPNIKWLDDPKDTTDSAPTKRPELKFYDTLKDMEVKVPDEVVAQREQEDYNYALQAGSFKSGNDANQLRAEIILLGLDANIEKRVSQTSGTTWHRVIVGPFTSRSALAKARSTLINNNIKTIRIKRS